jgi:RNA polymerase I-specific transcription initiation factor RRN6
MRWLSKFYPETYPGLNTISTLVKTQSLIETAVHEGSLITTAHAKDTYKISGSRRPTILAFSSGASGHVLHLIKPGSETRSWSNYREARLKLLDPSHLEHGYWTGTGGGIRQIVSADSEEIKTGPWLAVRQDTTVTIFEPVYGKMLEPMVSLLDRTETVSTSMLNPNPVVSLSVERTSSKVHVDFTFNPFYPRQFAVIGESGCWSIWNVESLHNKGSTRFLTPGRSGEHSESQIQDGSSSTGKYYLEHADGWHKILWVCDVDTIMVCSRRHLAVVSLKLSPGRLISANFLPTKGFDWILDAARSLISPDHLFILTTSRIYWIKIFLAEDGTLIISSFQG